MNIPLHSIRRLLATLIAGQLACVTLASSEGLIVHEWGTFTSVSGGDGVLLRWQPFQSKDLPEFVHDWKKPGAGRQMQPWPFFTKGGLLTLQRMETPVIYFYSDREITADVTVNFPGGFITEWYPQATHVSGVNQPANEGATNALVASQSPKDSVIRWRDVRVLSADAGAQISGLLPSSDAGNHYFAARETDANFLRVANLDPVNPASEYEKLLFYRGAGDFSTPLTVTVDDRNTLTVANTGTEALAHLFLLQVRGGKGIWNKLESLLPGEVRPWHRLQAGKNATLSSEDFTAQLERELEAALRSAGLFGREARAMVNTWNRSWFAEDGVRVLYLLPRGWTDTTLPLTLSPQPNELVRVMVGRAEVIPPSLQQELASQLTLAKEGNAAAQARLDAAARQLGRFYGPAHQLASAPSNLKIP